MNEKISVIIPVYNLESKISRCLTSVVNQTYKNLDIIVVDDGSTDNTVQIVRNFNDPRIRIIQKENHGISSARNAGLKEVKDNSKYISFIDGDDVVLISYFEEMMRVVDGYGADIVQCRIKQFKDDEVFSIDISATEGVVQIYDTTDDKIDMFMENDAETSFQCNKIFRKDIFKRIRFRDGFIHEGEDLILEELAHCNRFATLDRNLYGYLEKDMENVSEEYVFKYIINGLEARDSQCRTLHSLKKDEEIVEIKRRALNEYISRYVTLVEKKNWKYRKEVLRRLFADAYKTSNVRFGAKDHLRYILFTMCPILAK